MQNIIDRFIRYAKIDTQSNPNSEKTPSTETQFDLANLLKNELIEMGFDAELTENCFVYCTIPSNSIKPIPKIGFIAHVDTAPDKSGKNVNPQIIENYQGGDILLGEDKTNPKSIIKFEDNIALKDCFGHTIITTDGTTLLGSDDKSGVTAIMELAKYIHENKDFIHGPIGIAFTPDEEIGRGADYFDIERFGCEYAYTIDGEMPPAINKETFSADHCWIKIYGNDIHPGSAKDIMVNAGRILSEIISKLPKDKSPEKTDGHQDYIHPHHFTGNVANAELMLLFRAFDEETLLKHRILIENLVNEQSLLNPKAKIEIEVKKIYRNMFDYLEKNPKGCNFLFEAVERTGLKASWQPIRGGTDGSKLTERGLPCPNIFTGGQNFHSEKEWLSVNSLEKTIQTMINLVQIWEEKS